MDFAGNHCGEVRSYDSDGLFERVSVKKRGTRGEGRLGPRMPRRGPVAGFLAHCASPAFSPGQEARNTLFYLTYCTKCVSELEAGIWKKVFRDVSVRL